MGAAQVLKVVLWIFLLLAGLFSLSVLLGAGEFRYYKSISVSLEITSPSFSLMGTSDDVGVPKLEDLTGTLQLSEYKGWWPRLAFLALSTGGLFVLYQLILIVQSVIDRESFTPANATRLRVMGFLLLSWFFLEPLLSWLYFESVAGDVSFSGIQLFFDQNLNMNLLFLSLVLLALAEVFRQGQETHMALVSKREEVQTNG